MNIDYEKLAKERFTGTNIQKFHQITAVSQGAINQQMAAVHALAPKDSPLRHLKQTFEDDKWILIDTDLGPPKIELLMDTQARTVLYTMTLVSGTYQYWEGSGPTAKQRTATVDKWTLVFKVNLDLQALEKDQLVPDYIKKSLKKLDDYSIQQLLVDLNTADIANFLEKESNIGLTTQLLKVTFAAYVQNYIDNIRHSDKRDHSIIHYIPKSKKPEDYPIPTFPPTDLNFQNLKFVQGTEKDDNMLIYLQMTGNKPVPPELLQPSANWVVPVPPGQAGYDGTVALSKEIFFDQWLLPKLNAFNRVTNIYIVSVKVWYDWAKATDNFKVEYSTGRSWPEDKGQWVYNESGSDENFQVYTYTYPNDHKQDQDRPSTYGSAQCTASNTMKIPVGFGKDSKKSTITIDGKSTMQIDWHPGWPSEEVKEDIKITWTVNITFDGVDHGNLKIEVDHTFKKEGNINQKFVEGIEAEIKAIEERLDTGEIKKGLQDALSESWAFVFAGSTDFFIDEAGFNKNRDLLAKLKYVSHAGMELEEL